MYKQDKIESFQVVDKAVKGIDRAATENFDKLIEKINIIKEKNSIEQHKKTTKIVSLKIFLMSGIMIIGFIFTLTVSILLMKAVINPIKNITEALIDISQGEGDLTKVIDESAKDETGEMAKYFNIFIEKIKDIVESIKNSGFEIKEMTEELHKANSSLADKNSTQASSMEEVSAEIEEISSSISSNTANIISVEKTIEKSSNAAAEVEKESGELINSMRKITIESQKIDSITEVIDEIAFQTNLLALNAAVEAARAGEHGKGFAVVALEVRNLASKSSKSAKEIKELIKNNLTQVISGEKMLENTVNSLNKLIVDIKNISMQVQDISQKAVEQNDSLDNIRKAVERIDGITQTNAGVSEEIAATTAVVEEKVNELISKISEFKIEH